MLRAQYPNARFEVFNASISGSNSHVMRGAALACAKAAPDMFVVYMGNNERNGFMLQKVFYRPGPWALGLPFIHANIFLSDMRLAQILNPASNLESVSAQDHITFAPEAEKVYTYYRANLEDIADAGTRAGARVVLCTLGSMLRDWCVDSKNHRELSPDLMKEWDAACAAGVAPQEKGDYPGAIQAYEEAAAIDSTYAELDDRIGRCYWMIEEYQKSRSACEEAREWDTTHSRPNRRINSIIVETAASRAGQGVVLADSASALADASPHGVTGPEFFWDFVHLTFEGNYVLASTVFEQVQRSLPDWIKPQSQGMAGPLSQEECGKRLGFCLPVLRDQIKRSYGLAVNYYHQPHEGFDKRLEELDRQIGDNELAMRLDAQRAAAALNGEDVGPRVQYIQNLMKRGNNAEDPDKNAADIRQQLVEALCIVGDFAAANAEIEDCVKASINLPAHVIEKVKSADKSRR